MGEIYKKLAKIQKELIAPKGQRNDFGKYNYRSCEDILKAVKPLCDENGCVLFLTNEMETILDRIYVKAIVRLIDVETGEMVVSSAHAREEESKKGMDGSQITGSSSSYARKYALAGLFCIDNEKDSDATNDGKTETTNTYTFKPKKAEEKPNNASNKASNDAVNEIVKRCNETDGVLQWLLTAYKISTFKELTPGQATNLLGAWDDVLKKFKESRGKLKNDKN